LTRYAACLVDSDQLLDPTLVTGQLLATEALRSWKQASGDEEESIIKQLGNFTNEAKLKMWNELFQNYLGSVLNRYPMPLLYILREQFIQTTPLEGNQFETDNGKVFKLLESLLIKGTYCSYIEPYKVASDRRGGYQVLMMHFEGLTVIGTLLKDLSLQLEKLQYTSDKANFLFDNFVDKHQAAWR
jgi:hypothetical protein